MNSINSTVKISVWGTTPIEDLKEVRVDNINVQTIVGTFNSNTVSRIGTLRFQQRRTFPDI